MSKARRLKEPKTPWLFRMMFRGWSESIETRRFLGLNNRAGLTPSDNVNLDTKVNYYTDIKSRDSHTIGVSELEAKSALNDRACKFFGTLVFSVIFFLSLLCIGMEELRALIYPDAVDFKLGNILAAIAITVIFYLVLFAWMGLKFNGMDHRWTNCLDSFFAAGSRAQMEAVRDSMREFKRFVKWRRYMRLMMQVAAIVLVVEVTLLAVSVQLGNAVGVQLSWSSAEQYFAAGFLVAQGCWLAGYWMMWVYYTTYRDPTLQLCIMVNSMDRARVAAVNVGGGSY